MLQQTAITQLTVADFPQTLLGLLRAMDQEAVGEKNGWPIGLRWYCQYERTLYPEREKGKDDIEDSWCRRLKSLLVERHGLRVELFSPYPYGGFTDIVVWFSDGEILWIEVKGVWSYNNDRSARTGLRKDNPRKYLYDRPGKCILDDVGKVNGLKRPHASHVGALLIGFDIEKPTTLSIPDADIEELKKRAGFLTVPWIGEYQAWPDQHQIAGPRREGQGYRVRCWFWYRTVPA